jgi:hypothetical protein
MELHTPGQGEFGHQSSYFRYRQDLLFGGMLSGLQDHRARRQSLQSDQQVDRMTLSLVLLQKLSFVAHLVFSAEYRNVNSKGNF